MRAPCHADIEARFMQTVALLASLSTAAEVRHAIMERRAGNDPSQQEEPGIAVSYLASVEPDLRELLVRLRLFLIREDAASSLVNLVHAFDRAMVVSRCNLLLNRIHQRLMSVYPAVSEELVERVRILQKRFGTDDDASETGHEEIDEALALCAELRALGDRIQ